MRNLSEEIFGNSKVLEKINHQVCCVLKSCLLLNGSDYIEKELLTDAEFDDKDLLRYFNVLFNSETILLKGNMTIDFTNGSKIILNGTAIGLQSNEMNNISNIQINDEKIYTIENLTTYNDSNLDGTMIYLEGFATKMCCELLKKINQYNSNKEYFHYGDIDAGGFYIFFDARKRKNITFQLYSL